MFVTVVTDDPQAAAEKLGPAFGLPPEVILAAPFFQLGTVEQITEDIWRSGSDGGISNILFQPDGMAPDGPGGRPAHRHLSRRAPALSGPPGPGRRGWR